MQKGVLIETMNEANKFKLINDAISKRITQNQADECLNLSERQVRRLIKSVKKEGLKGVIHKARGKPSKRKIPKKTKNKIIHLAETKYVDFKPTFFAEKLNNNEKIKISNESVRKMLIEAGL